MIFTAKTTAKWRQWLAIGLAALACRIAGGFETYQPVFADPLLEPWRWRTFPHLSGLGAHCIGEGPGGSLWFGAGEALWEYNGFEWKAHASSEGLVGTVTSVVTGYDGLLYAGGRDGIYRYEDGRWQRILATRSLRLGDIRKLLSGRDGSLWAATSTGALHLAGDKWTLFTAPIVAKGLEGRKLPPNFRVDLIPQDIVDRPRPSPLAATRHDFFDIAEDRHGQIWLGTNEGEILRLALSRGEKEITSTPETAPAEWTLFNETDGMACGRGPCILPLQNGDIWVAYGSGLGRLNIFHGGSWTTVDLAEAGAPEDCGSLLQARDGTVWWSARYVLAAYRDGGWRTYSKPEVPIPTTRNFILQTTDGALWIGGPNTEIHRVDYQTPRWTTLPDLNFQWESATGAQWFLHRSGRIVCREREQWTSYGVEDGLIDAPTVLLGTRRGEVWVAGSHGGEAATARFDGRGWQRDIHDDLSWGIESRGVLESADGSLWFAAAVDSSGPKKHRAGILQYRDGQWIHHHQPGRGPVDGTPTPPEALLPATQRPEPIGKFLRLGESSDGRIWAGRNILIYRDDAAWNVFTPPDTLRLGIIETLFTTSSRDLWLGTRQFGALRYKNGQWGSHQGKDSLVANSVRSFAETSDGSLWAATDRGFSRFDGTTWTSDLLPEPMTLPHDGGTIIGSASGGIWINRSDPDWSRQAWAKAARLNTAKCEFWTVGHHFRGPPPETTVTSGPREVAHPGNISVLWAGVAPWRTAETVRLQYSFRLDNQPWSPFSSAPGRAFFTLAGGAHRLEVRARDEDFNVDPTPATLDFVVLPPVWRQGWFLLLMASTTTLILAQGLRVVLDRGRLRRANRELAGEIRERQRTEDELQKLNLELDKRVQNRTSQLELANKELESFSYSVSHDLRAPLRAIDGFSRILIEDYATRLDSEGMRCLHDVRAGARRMSQLIDDMLSLSRVARLSMQHEKVNLSAIASEIAGQLTRTSPERRSTWSIAPDVTVVCDSRFLRIALDNLLGNAWKFTSKREIAKIEFGTTREPGTTICFVRDNGAGFDMNYAQHLFEPFRRMHRDDDFPGSGIGLAIVQRIIHRHGGRIWAESRPDDGTTIRFAIPDAPGGLAAASEGPGEASRSQ